MKIIALSYLLGTISMCLNAQNYYRNVFDFSGGTFGGSKIEIFDTTQWHPRVLIEEDNNTRVFDSRVTASGHFAFMKTQLGSTGTYYFLDSHLNPVDSLTHQSTSAYETIDPHSVYKDDSMTIFILQKIITIPTPIFLPDYGFCSNILDNIIVVKKHGQVVLEFSNWLNFEPKYIEMAPSTDTTLIWDVAHVNSVAWDGTGILISNLCYGIYKIDIQGNIMWEQDSLVFTADIPRLQHDFAYLGNGLYSIFSNGDENNNLFAATFRIVNDTVVYDFFHAPAIGMSFALGNFQAEGVINYGLHENKFEILNYNGLVYPMAEGEFAYRAEKHNMVIPADIIVVGDSFLYQPVNPNSTLLWSTGETGNQSLAMFGTVSVTEVTPFGIKIFTERTFKATDISDPTTVIQTPATGKSYNLYGQPCEPKGLYIKDGRVFCTPQP